MECYSIHCGLKFDIERVPAVVVVNKESQCLKNNVCHNNNFNVLYGDISLASALNEISGRSIQKSNISSDHNKSHTI